MSMLPTPKVCPKCHGILYWKIIEPRPCQKHFCVTRRGFLCLGMDNKYGCGYCEVLINGRLRPIFPCKYD